MNDQERYLLEDQLLIYMLSCGWKDGRVTPFHLKFSMINSTCDRFARQIMQTGQPVTRATIFAVSNDEALTAKLIQIEFQRPLNKAEIEVVLERLGEVYKAAAFNQVLQNHHGADEATVSEKLSSAARELEQLKTQNHNSNQGNDYGDIRAEVEWRRKNPYKVKGMSIGFPSLEQLIDGWQEEIHVVGAWPGVGKTSFCMSMVYGALMSGEIPTYFGLEGRASSFQKRLIEIESGVSIRDMKSDANYAKTTAAVEKMEQYSWFSNGRQSSIEAIIDQGISDRANGATIGFIDYAQIIKAGGKGSTDNIERAMDGLQILLKATEIPWIVAAQLRKPDLRFGKDGEVVMPIPDKRMLFGSSRLEHDPRVVCILDRRDFQPDRRPEMRDPRQPCTLMVQKNNEGACGSVDMEFLNRSKRWVEDQSSEV